jgi:hypothetical protein
MSPSDNFSIIDHAKDVNDHNGFQPYELEYSNIAGKASLVKDEEDQKKKEEAESALTRIDLKHHYTRHAETRYSEKYDSIGTVKLGLFVQESIAEVNEKIQNAQIEHIKALQKHSIFIS